MPANPMQERRDLDTVLSVESPARLLVRVAITVEVPVSADGPDGMPIRVVLQPPGVAGAKRQYNLLDYATAAAWRASKSLSTAVDKGWLYVDLDSPTQQAGRAATTDDCCGITPPDNAQPGDLLIFDGNRWARLPPGPSGRVLSSAGAGQPLVWSMGGSGNVPNGEGNAINVLFEGTEAPLFRRITQADILPNFAINSLTIDTGSSSPPSLSTLVERGTLITPYFNAAANRSPTAASLNDTHNNDPMDVVDAFTGANATNLPGLPAQKTAAGATFQTAVYTLTADDGQVVATASLTFTWGRRVYFGVSNHAAPYTMAEIQGLANKPIATSRGRTFSVTAGPGQYIVYAYLGALGDATFSVGGFSGGFTKVQNALSVMTENGALTGSTVTSENYFVWQSDNPSLGATTVTVG